VHLLEGGFRECSRNVHESLKKKSANSWKTIRFASMQREAGVNLDGPGGARRDRLDACLYQRKQPI
jgi:hypothetical protein